MPMDLIPLRPEAYRPAPPPDAIRQRYGIGLVGCGRIARNAHLRAYRDFGYRVVAACDVVDLAVHASQRRPLVERIAAAGKHILSQKPFALTLDDAVHMVDVC
ncbi:MAG: Gfo/Idh/MocA family oxidoreductase, partial [Chloroflexi bacterium]|nr:Gfo/Idh/MocA family oxidoreductase [Chloroflexota bacterium]